MVHASGTVDGTCIGDRCPDAVRIVSLCSEFPAVLGPHETVKVHGTAYAPLHVKYDSMLDESTIVKANFSTVLLTEAVEPNNMDDGYKNFEPIEGCQL